MDPVIIVLISLACVAIGYTLAYLIFIGSYFSVLRSLKYVQQVLEIREKDYERLLQITLNYIAPGQVFPPSYDSETQQRFEPRNDEVEAKISGVN